ncbi:hypothetical protein Efla_007083 [Eimeria flavescens]
MFATKRHRLDEYDSYEATVNPQRVPPEFGRVPIHLQSAGELKETITVAGRLRLRNPNFWMRCSSAVRDLSASFRLRELVAIVNAYAKAGYRDAALFDHLAQLIALQAHDGRASDLAVCLQAFARLSISNEPLFDLLALQCMRKMEDLGPRGLATVAAAYGGVGIPHSRLFEMLAAQAEQQATAFCNLELTQLLWGCSRVGYKNFKLLNCWADQLMLRVSTCSELEVLTAAEAFAVLEFYRPDLVACLSAFFLRKIQGLPLRHLPMLLQSFIIFDNLAGDANGRAEGQAVLAPSPNAALYRAVLPAIARRASCFSLSELAAVDSALRSVGLTHDMLTGALHQLISQRASQLSPQDCVQMLHHAAARGNSSKDQAVAVALQLLLGPADFLGALPAASVLHVLESLRRLHDHQALAFCASLLFSQEQRRGSTQLGGTELLVAQRIILQAFPSKGAFLSAHCGDRWWKLRGMPVGPSITPEGGSWKSPAISNESGRGDTKVGQAEAVYEAIAAAASNASANSLILAICQKRGDPGTWLWLEVLSRGKITSADPELLPALMAELAHLLAEQTQAEEFAVHCLSLGMRSPAYQIDWNLKMLFAVSQDQESIKQEQISLRGEFPPAPSAAHLSGLFCRLARFLMEGAASELSSSFGHLAHSHALQHEGGRAGEESTSFEGDPLSRLSLNAGATAAKALLSHPNQKVARRYVEQLCLLMCRRLQRPDGDEAEEGSRIARQQEAKSLARLLQALVALEGATPAELLQHLARRIRWLEGTDVLSVLRLLPRDGLNAPLRQQLARAVNLRYRDLRSWRRLWELKEVCATLQLDVEDDIFQLESSMPGHSAAGGEKDIPTIAHAARGDSEERSRHEEAGSLTDSLARRMAV